MENLKYRRAKTPTVIQMEAVECGVASLSIVLGYYNRYVPLEQLRIECGVSRDGSNAFNLIKAAKKFGLEGTGFKMNAEELLDIEYPAILFWEFNHFVVLEGFGKNIVYLNDPATGPRTLNYEDFIKSYAGAVLTFTKTEEFKKGGKPPSLIVMLYDRLKSSANPLTFLLLTGLCLLIPGFALPAFLMVLLNTFFSISIIPWKAEFLAAVLLTAFFAGALTWTQKYFLNRLNSKLSIWFSSAFLWHLLRLPISFYTQRYTGEISYRMSLNNTVAQTLTGSITSTVIDLLLIFFYAIVMFFYDVVIASIALFAAIINLCVMLMIFRARSNAYARLQQDITRSMTESIGGLQYIESIKAKGSESDFFSKWAGYYAKSLNSRQEIGKKDVILSTVPVFFQLLATTALLGIGSLRIIEGSISVAMLMAMQLLMINFLQPINRFVGYSQLIQNTKIDIERLNDVMKNAEDKIYLQRSMHTKKEDLHKLEGCLEFRNVSFRYSPLAPLLINNLSFIIKPGHRLALVGPTGCGKSTIAKLAAGLFHPESGVILYDGHPIEEISSELFRNSIATVDQEFFLFAESIRDNLTLWNYKVPEEMILAATHDACIHDEILLRAGGYDSLLFEGGANLSGGQRQRLEIARALLYNPSLLILDEATSALDSKTEKIVSDKIRQRGCSVLMIAHRLSTIQDCDEIIVLDKGIPIQRGTHNELKVISGVYQTLVNSETIDE